MKRSPAQRAASKKNWQKLRLEGALKFLSEHISPDLLERVKLAAELSISTRAKDH